jgi:branched-chain amino acid transport system ATP-binding protein
MSFLELESVYAGYEGSDVLQGVSLSVEEGSVVTLLGRNGVGKTTTLRSIVGLVEPSGGAVRFDGEDITGSSPHAVYDRGIGFVTEDRGIFPDLTVEENLRVPVVEESEGLPMSDVYDFFPKLEELEASKGKHLSGGEKQMLAIARALRGDPRLLLLDEPSEGLAPQIVENVGRVVEEIASSGTTLLIVEQNVKFALDMAEYTYIMDNGSIVFEGTDDEVEEKDEEVRNYLGVHENDRT